MTRQILDYLDYLDENRQSIKIDQKFMYIKGMKGDILNLHGAFCDFYMRQTGNGQWKIRRGFDLPNGGYIGEFMLPGATRGSIIYPHRDIIAWAGLQTFPIEFHDIVIGHVYFRELDLQNVDQAIKVILGALS